MDSLPKILFAHVLKQSYCRYLQSGFIEGTLLIPGFVLEELQHIADSSDLLKRNRGRRGLDILNRIQKEMGVFVQIDNRNFEDVAEVDSKLVKLGQLIKGKILTNDYLNKVAELQGVTVMNINELANAVKPVIVAWRRNGCACGQGRQEAGQGVAYLDDGTMIVVDNGRKHLGDTIDVLVTSVLPDGSWADDIRQIEITVRIKECSHGIA